LYFLSLLDLLLLYIVAGGLCPTVLFKKKKTGGPTSKLEVGNPLNTWHTTGTLSLAGVTTKSRPDMPIEVNGASKAKPLRKLRCRCHPSRNWTRFSPREHAAGLSLKGGALSRERDAHGSLHHPPERRLGLAPSATNPAATDHHSKPVPPL
jgi:hypothetical protein